ncbi:hypothetical protein KIW84_036222 [Lathyrus oleraceus]|uniref:Bidirectional sugar transporter SWEET n=3 Tax=Pisum sativum TaxID=3888 RepID=A0A9D4Y928_PEA|nr:hypothetical protein KIW84_036222 [Pisum sativum]
MEEERAREAEILRAKEAEAKALADAAAAAEAEAQAAAEAEAQAAAKAEAKAAAEAQQALTQGESLNQLITQDMVTGIPSLEMPDKLYEGDATNKPLMGYEVDEESSEHGEIPIDNVPFSVKVEADNREGVHAWFKHTHCPILSHITHKEEEKNIYISKMFTFSNHEMVLIFGLLGNIVSFLVFLAPLPTFYSIYKKKSSEGFQSIPYVVALLSALLLLYYGFLKTNALLIITINCIGCVIEVIYLIMFIIYAPKKLKISTLILILVADIGGFGMTMIITFFIVKRAFRVHAVGLICAIFNIAVFAAPLSIMRRVIKTRSVEFMPFSLSLFLTLCATMWFFYGLFDKDNYIMMPNVLGFLFGISQMILYLIYKNAKNKVEANSTEKQEHGFDDDDNKQNFTSMVEMKENIV